jgi:capsular exopolysaccharide synthesis family protein
MVQYRRLARGLQRMQGERGLNRLLVTSARPGDGRTSTVTHTALALSEHFDRRVLVIDADVRHPAVQGFFGVTSRHGLLDVLLGNCRDLPLVGVARNLTVLPGGRPDPNAIPLLTSDRMEWLVSQCASHFDWILVDGPPVSLMPDPQLLARMTGAVLFVIAAGASSYSTVRQSLDALGADCVVGSVLTRVSARHMSATPTPIEPTDAAGQSDTAAAPEQV